MNKTSNTDTLAWRPPESIDELYKATSGNRFATMNKPHAGAQREQNLPSGTAPIQLYSLATPNGKKVGILFEELIEAGCDCRYDAFYIDIGKGDQFSSGFVDINPNSKIPACIDRDGPEGRTVKLFESGSICLYFAEKYSHFIPEDPVLKAEMMNWLFWQMASQGPMTGQFGHYFVYAPDDKKEARDYGVGRYGMEVQRLCDVLNTQLADKRYIMGEQFSLADIMIFPWFHQLVTGYAHSSGIRVYDFLSIDQYEHAIRWCHDIAKRPGVERGLLVCSSPD